jgi:dTDP-4-amino-4,6-dideoxy-D-galactose acyltransferase
MGSDPLTPLPWDSGHFGFPVARLTVPGGDAAAAAAALAEARRRGVVLVYWAVDPAHAVPGPLLTEFAGCLADRKATFTAELAAVDRGAAGESLGGLGVRDYPRGPASEALTALAVAAGEFSRFRADPRVPRDRFVSLYGIWAERSARREMADAVLVAAEAEGAVPAGFVTASEAGGGASIGLIAVAAAARGRGVGGLLMRAVHRWMAGRGAARVTVVTQLDNVPACRLYERCGYHLAGVKHSYHFWPQA